MKPYIRTAIGKSGNGYQKWNCEKQRWSEPIYDVAFVQRCYL